MSDTWWRGAEEKPPPVKGSSRKKGIGIAAVCILAVGLYFILRGGASGTDEEQIRNLVVTGKQAVEEHDLPTLMGLVSHEYHDDIGLNRDRLRLVLAQTFRDQTGTSVNISSLQITPQGDTATMAVTATLTGRSNTTGRGESGSYTITFQLKKEPGYRFLVIPTQTWRVVSSSGSGLSFDNSVFGL